MEAFSEGGSGTNFSQPANLTGEEDSALSGMLSLFSKCHLQNTMPEPL